jgi:predicted Rossmann-fold nucleotide-binding protein
LPDSGAEGTRASSRNHLNVLSASALVAFPGNAGTFSEMWLATMYGVPIVAHGSHASVPPGVRRTTSLDEVTAFLGETVRARPYPPFHSFR